MKLAIPVIAVAILSFTVVSIYAEEPLIPLWIKAIAEFWVSGDIKDEEFISAMEWLIENGLEIVVTVLDKHIVDDSYTFTFSYIVN